MNRKEPPSEPDKLILAIAWQRVEIAAKRLDMALARQSITPAGRQALERDDG